MAASGEHREPARDRSSGRVDDDVLMPRPFRFLADARRIADMEELRETVKRAEAIGIDSLVIPDHLIEQLSPVAGMTAVVAPSPGQPH